MRALFLRQSGLARLACALVLCAPTASRAVEPIRDFPFWQEYHEPHPFASPKENDVRAVAIDRDGTVWAATAAGVRFLDGTRWKTPPGGNEAGLSFSLHARSEGGVWVGSWNGILRATRGGVAPAAASGAAIAAIGGNEKVLYAGGPDGTWRLESGEWKPTKVSWARSISAFAVAPGGGLWIATGLGLFRHAANDAEDQSTDFHRPADILSSMQYSLAWGPGGTLWIGSTGGIDVYDGTRRVRSFIGGVGGMPNRHARSMAFDADGRLWVATPLGVARLDGDAWRLRHSRRWLLSDDARCVVIDGEGTAWIATAAGVSAIKRKRMTLADKADHYLAILRARHIRPPGLLGPAVLKQPGELEGSWVTDTDNDGSFTGQYIFAEACRSAVTHAEDARRNAEESFGALELLQTVTSTPHFIARTIVPTGATPQNDRNRTYTPEEAAEHRLRDSRFKLVENRWLPSADGKWLWKRDTSSDEAVGHMFAYAAYFDLVADANGRKRAADLTRKLIGGIIDNGFELKDIDGKPTRWGVWSPERLLRDPDWRAQRDHNAVEILSFLNAADHITGEKRFRDAARLLIDKHGYAFNASRPKVSAISELTHIDEDLLSMSYPSLMAYEKDPRLLELYQAGMRQWHPYIAEEHSPLYDFLFNRFSGEQVALDGAGFVLRDWPLDLVEWVVDNTKREDVTLDPRYDWDGLLTVQNLPPSEHGNVQWDHSPRKAIRGNGPLEEGTGIGWLLGYWMGRYYGFIGPPEKK